MRYGNRIKNNRHILSILTKYFAFMVLLILFIFDTYNPKPLQFIRTISIDIGKPIYNAVSKPFIAINSSLESITEIKNLKEENEKLKETVNYLFKEKLKLAKIMDENQKLKDISGYNKKITTNSYVAKIIGRISSESKNVYILNLGENDNIHPKMPAVNKLGYVGKILSVGSHTSQLILATDYRSKISVKIVGKNVNAIMSGNNRYNTYLEYTDKEANIEEGDLVFTSGHDNIIPEDIPVGKIIFEENNPIAQVKLFNNPENISFVKIISFENVN